MTKIEPIKGFRPPQVSGFDLKTSTFKIRTLIGITTSRVN